MKKIFAFWLYFGICQSIQSQSLGGVDLSRFVYGENQTKTSWFSDPNNVYNSGFYNNSTDVNMPYNTWWHMIISRHLNTSNNYQFQLAADFWGDNTYFRKITDGYAQSWRRILNNGQDPFAANLNQNLRTSDNVAFAKVSVNGIIQAKKLVITQTGWSDYVFAKNYKLRTLPEVENYIKAYQHLPDVPSAKEVAAKGISVGDTQALLLKKIEELTLYVIELKKENKSQNEKIKNMYELISKLKDNSK